MGFIRAIKAALTDHSGTGHRIAHDMTMIANIPLVAWLVYTVFSLRDTGYEGFQAWLSQPFHMVMASLFVTITLTHFTLELETVFEDYIADADFRNVVIKLMKVFWFTLGAVTIGSIVTFGL